MLRLQLLRLSTMVAVLWGICSIGVTAGAESLSYSWKDGQKFSYEIVVTVETDAATITYKGITNYTVNRTSPGQASITYRGGLRETKKYKPTNRSNRRGPFGPRGFGGRPSIPSPFSRPTFAGKTQTTNKLTITSRGQTLTMEGTSQLPYLLGNVSLLPFESLPRGSEKQWSVDSGVSITKKDENRRDRFGPFGPFAGSGDQSVQAGGEVSNYSIQSDRGNLVVIKKSYRLHTPQVGDKAAYDLSGAGTWTFDRQENVPHAYDMKLKLTVSSGNSTTVYPISIKYKRISAAKLAEMAATAKKKADEMAAAAAKKKAIAEAALSPSVKSNALASLSSSENASVLKTLGELAAKSPKEPDSQIAAAIEQLLTSTDKSVAGAAHKALVKWSPSYSLKTRLAKEYQHYSPVKSTKLVVESITPLYVGQIVQVQLRTFWRPAIIKKLLPDGKVDIAHLLWGKDHMPATVARRNIQLAPPELEQPARPKSVSASVSKSGAPATGKGSRTWSDVSGKFQVEAKFVSVSDGKVNLLRADGRILSVPLEKLSPKDQAFVEQMQAPENPFNID